MLRDPGELKVSKEAFPLQPNRYVILFKEKGETVRGVPAEEQWPFVESVLPKWTGGESIPVRQPIKSTVVLAVVPTVVALLFVWGGISTANNPDRPPGQVNYPLVCAGVVGVLALLLWMLAGWVIVRAMRPPAVTPT